MHTMSEEEGWGKASIMKNNEERKLKSKRYVIKIGKYNQNLFQ